MRILVVDDERGVRTSVERALRLDGHEVELAADGREALVRLAADSPDAVVLDVLMPEVDGLEVCRRLRSLGDRTPVLMLTARDAVQDRVAGLDAGADDYLVKPFALEELLARVRALLRRTSANGDSGLLQFADLKLDERTYEVHRGDRRIELTRTEFLLLELFLRNPCVFFEFVGEVHPRARATTHRPRSPLPLLRPRCRIGTVKPATSGNSAKSASWGSAHDVAASHDHGHRHVVACRGRYGANARGLQR